MIVRTGDGFLQSEPQPLHWFASFLDSRSMIHSGYTMIAAQNAPAPHIPKQTFIRILFMLY